MVVSTFMYQQNYIVSRKTGDSQFTQFYVEEVEVCPIRSNIFIVGYYMEVLYCQCNTSIVNIFCSIGILHFARIRERVIFSPGIHVIDYISEGNPGLESSFPPS